MTDHCAAAVDTPRLGHQNKRGVAGGSKVLPGAKFISACTAMQEEWAQQRTNSNSKSKVRNDENDLCANFGDVRFAGGQFCERGGSDDDFGGKRRNARKCDHSGAA